MMYEIPSWPDKPQEWDENCLKLLLLDKAIKPPEMPVKEFLEKSENFPISFPIETVRCKHLIEQVDPKILERNINSVYPIVHEKVLHLCARFLLQKRTNGTPKEKALYDKMSVVGLIERLLTKKALLFLGFHDAYILVDQTNGIGAWHTIGTKKESEQINLNKCLSYDELKLGALLSLSSYTYFVNKGDRMNSGRWASERDEIEDEGVIIGLIGTRLVKENAMETEEIMYAKNQNTKSNGYGVKNSVKTLMAEFYEETFYTYSELVKKAKKNSERYPNERGIYFDNVTYAKRMSLSFDTLLIEANERAKKANKFAYVHAVGLGLGVWKAFLHQRQLYLDIFVKRIQALGKTLPHISDIYFDYFPPESVALGYRNGAKISIESHPRSGIFIYMGTRDPHRKLTGEHEGKLLVVSYAADSNSLPGNEFWDKCLHHSSDSAAAASTQISELHNPHINRNVTVGNLRVATMDDGVLQLEEYIEKVVGQKK